MNEIIIAGRPFPIEAKVVNFTQSPFWNATVEACVSPKRICAGGVTPYGEDAKNKGQRRYAFRPQIRKYGKHPPLEAVKALIRQFVIHHDGCWSAQMCWEVLHNERGLSCHFLIDNDGTIFQTIDLAYMAYHAAEFNVSSIGVELCSRGEAHGDPNANEYRKRGLKRTTQPCRINGHTMLAYDFAPAQYDALRALARGLTRLLPNVPLEYPQDLPGKQSWNTMPSAYSYAGYLGHYHCTSRKWDPGPFDFKTFCEKLRGANCFPLWTRKDPPPERPVVPDRTDLLLAEIKDLYRANESRADGGFFPVGPWGESRLWHGGVHLVGDTAQPVYAPFPGRVVAARMGATSPAGSTNFVLLKHDMAVGKSPIRFYSLYMHLSDELAANQPAPWLGKDSWKQHGKGNEVVLLDEPVEAGEIVGRIGKAGPADLSKAQLHFEIFAATELFSEMDPNPWTVIDGSAGGRFCDQDDLTRPIDKNKDGKLARSELTGFFSGGGGELEILRYRVTYNVSEWTAEPSWNDALRAPGDFSGLSPAEIDLMVAEQITPGLWWSEAVAKHCRLPVDGVVYHYHPVTFLRFVNERIVEAQVGGDSDVIDPTLIKEVPKDITDDFGDTTGESAVSDADLTDADPFEHLTLEQMIGGYAQDPNAP